MSYSLSCHIPCHIACHEKCGSPTHQDDNEESFKKNFFLSVLLWIFPFLPESKPVALSHSHIIDLKETTKLVVSPPLRKTKCGQETGCH